jgi:hypothetical protein
MITLIQAFKSNEKLERVVNKYKEYKNQFVTEYYKRYNDITAQIDLIEIVRGLKCIPQELIDLIPELQPFACVEKVEVKEEVIEEVKAETEEEKVPAKRTRKKKEVVTE